jgi:hypothetical protein
MSDTLETMSLMLAEQFGIRPAEVDPDSPLEALGMDVADLEKLKILIEESYSIDISVIEEEHQEIDVDKPARNLKDQTLRQLSSWVDDWINREEIHPRSHGRNTKPS